MNNQSSVIGTKRSILEEIINQLTLNDRYLVQQYLKGEKIDEPDLVRVVNLEGAMKSETDSWWNSVYSQERAYRQFYCSTLILNFDVYRQDMQKLLKRRVTDAELFERKRIVNEVNYNYKEWKRKQQQ